MRTFKPIGVFTADQHANLARAGLCGCAECSEHDAIDETILKIVGSPSTPPAFGWRTPMLERMQPTNIKVGCDFVCGKCDKCSPLIVALGAAVAAVEQGESIDDLFGKCFQSKAARDSESRALTQSDSYAFDCMQAVTDRLSMIPILLRTLLAREFDACLITDRSPLLSMNEGKLVKSVQHMGRFLLCVNFAAGAGTSLERCAMDPCKTNVLLLSILERRSLRHEDVADIITKWMSMDGRAKPVRRTSIPVPLHLLSYT